MSVNLSAFCQSLVISPLDQIQTKPNYHSLIGVGRNDNTVYNYQDLAMKTLTESLNNIVRELRQKYYHDLWLCRIFGHRQSFRVLLKCQLTKSFNYKYISKHKAYHIIEETTKRFLKLSSLLYLVFGFSHGRKGQSFDDYCWDFYVKIMNNLDDFYPDIKTFEDKRVNSCWSYYLKRRQSYKTTINNFKDYLVVGNFEKPPSLFVHHSLEKYLSNTELSSYISSKTSKLDVTDKAKILCLLWTCIKAQDKMEIWNGLDSKSKNLLYARSPIRVKCDILTVTCEDEYERAHIPPLFPWLINDNLITNDFFETRYTLLSRC